jgi:RsiW-degrading membrane proteinase PrsW (M82 family)
LSWWVEPSPCSWLSLYFEAAPFLGNLGAAVVGIVEEIAKLAALLIVMRTVKYDRYKYRLNGLLSGAAFLSAGYALRSGLLINA